MRTYTSSRAKRKRFYRKSGFQMFFVDFRSPCWCTKMVYQRGDSIERVVKGGGGGGGTHHASRQIFK